VTEPTDPATTIPGEVLRAARLKAGLTQTQVARVAGVSPQFVSQVELGDRPAPELFIDVVLTLNPELDAPGEDKPSQRIEAERVPAPRGPMATKPATGPRRSSTY